MPPPSRVLRAPRDYPGSRPSGGLPDNAVHQAHDPAAVAVPDAGASRRGGKQEVGRGATKNSQAARQPGSQAALQLGRQAANAMRSKSDGAQDSPYTPDTSLRNLNPRNSRNARAKDTFSRQLKYEASLRGLGPRESVSEEAATSAGCRKREHRNPEGPAVPA